MHTNLAKIADHLTEGIRQIKHHTQAYKFLLHGSTNTPRMPVLDKTHKTTSQYGYAANTLISTVDINMENIKEWAILDSGATIHFLVTAASKSNVQLAINPLIIKLPDGAQVRSTAKCIQAIL